MMPPLETINFSGWCCWGMVSYLSVRAKVQLDSEACRVLNIERAVVGSSV
jgi:hypothetical protein